VTPRSYDAESSDGLRAAEKELVLLRTARGGRQRYTLEINAGARDRVRDQNNIIMRCITAGLRRRATRSSCWQSEKVLAKRLTKSCPTRSLPNAYGWLKSEFMHRPGSAPYDSAAKRHAVQLPVWAHPVVDDKYRDRRAGQGHPSTPTVRRRPAREHYGPAVRITHFPHRHR
jgi:hypothetical protein